MKQNKSKLNKLKNKLMLNYLLVFTLLISATAMLVYHTFRAQMIDEIGLTRVDVLRQIGERTNSINNSITTISNLYAINPSLNTALTQEDADQAAIKREFDSLKADYDKIFSDIGINYEIVIIGDNGFTYSSKDGDEYNFQSIQNQLWYQKNLDKQEISFISSFKDVYGHEGNSYVFSAFRTIFDKEERLGTLMVNIDESHLAQTYQSVLNNDNNIYIVDRQGNIISHKDESLRGMNFIDSYNFQLLYADNNYHLFTKLNEEYLLSNYYDEQTGWRIIEEIPSAVIFSKVYDAIFILGWFVLIGIAFAIFVSYNRSKKISEPILELCQNMEEVIQGNLMVKSDATGYEEIEKLSQGFNQMINEINTLMNEIKIEEANKRKSELDFLRAQINPHFLYNTLFSIKCLVEIGKNEQAATMMQAFIDLLKLTLSVSTDLLSLEDELNATIKYIKLQQFRYTDQLSYEIDFDEESHHCEVPSLILQPIVENALFHGLEPKNENGMLILTSRIQAGKLYLSVSDDGVGMKQEIIDKIMNHEYKVKKGSKSIGLANITDRIEMHFGKPYGLTIHSEEGIGTTVTLCLPIVKKEGQQ